MKNIAKLILLAFAIALACFSDLSDISIEMNFELKFFGAIIFVCAPMPQPASSINEFLSQMESWCKRSSNESAWSCNLLDSFEEYPCTYLFILPKYTSHLTNKKAPR